MMAHPDKIGRGVKKCNHIAFFLLKNKKEIWQRIYSNSKQNSTVH
jgi:hypothetical protein